MISLFRISIFAVLASASLSQAEQDCSGRYCPAQYKPVCANNGKTYRNNCELQKAACKDSDIAFAHAGTCKTGSLHCVTPIACIARYAPVCGTDGQTYSNGCYLEVARCSNPGLKMKHKGNVYETDVKV